MTINNLPLSVKHYAELSEGSAIPDETIVTRGYRTITDPQRLPTEFRGPQRIPGLLIPSRDVQGTLRHRLKPDEPRESGGKYEQPSGWSPWLDVPSQVVPVLADPRVPLWITEGEKKVDSANGHGIHTIGIQGVWNWQRTSENGIRVPLVDWDAIVKRGREFVIAFDSDMSTNTNVRDAALALQVSLATQGANVKYLVLSERLNGGKCGVDDHFADGGTAEGLKGLLADSLPEIEWPAAIPIDPPYGPPFPVEVLPGTLGTYVKAVSEGYQVPADMPACFALGSISACVRGGYSVAIPERGWSVPVLIQTTVAMEPSAKKSPTYKEIASPIYVWESEAQERMLPDYREWLSKLRVLESTLKQAEEVQSKRKGDPLECEADRRDANQRLSEHLGRKPIIPQIIADDVSGPAIKTMIAEQGGPVAAMSAEQTFWDNMAGRTGNGSTDWGAVKQGFDGEPIRVRRSTREPDITPNAYLTICIATQLEPFTKLCKAEGFVGEGPAARLLPSIPHPMGQRTRTTAIPESLRATWSAGLNALLDRKPGNAPRPILLSSSALQVFERFEDKYEAERMKSEREDDPSIVSWKGKKLGQVLRIAGLLHVWSHAQHDPDSFAIDQSTITSACAIVDYFQSHTYALHRLTRQGAQGRALQVWEVLQSLSQQTTRREIHRKLHGRSWVTGSESLADPLRTLEEHGYIQQRDKGKSGIVIRRPGNIVTMVTVDPENSELSPLSLSFRVANSNDDLTTMQERPPGDDLKHTDPVKWLQQFASGRPLGDAA